MLRHAPSIKAVVLYITWINTPADPAMVQTQIVGGEDRIRNAFGWLAQFTSPASLSARAAILRTVYTLGHMVEPRGQLPFEAQWPDVIQSLRANGGWWAEHDPHHTVRKQTEMLTSLCGPTAVT